MAQGEFMYGELLVWPSEVRDLFDLAARSFLVVESLLLDILLSS